MVNSMNEIAHPAPDSEPAAQDAIQQPTPEQVHYAPGAGTEHQNPTTQSAGAQPSAHVALQAFVNGWQQEASAQYAEMSATDRHLYTLNQISWQSYLYLKSIRAMLIWFTVLSVLAILGMLFMTIELGNAIEDSRRF